MSLLPGSSCVPSPPLLTLGRPLGSVWASPHLLQPETLQSESWGSAACFPLLGITGPTAWLPISDNWCFMYFCLGSGCFSWKGISGLFHLILCENKSPISLFLM